MDKLPLISIIVPFYNVEEYLEPCLLSIKNQTYKNIEVILVNDGSVDNSINICEKIISEDNRFKLFNKPNGGISDARNFGIEKATGEYISFIDSDDEVTTDYIQYLYELIVKYNTKISVTAHTINNNDSKFIFHGFSSERKITQKEALKSILLDNGVDLSPWGKIYKKDLFDNIKYPTGFIFEDTATTYKLIYKCDFVACGNESKYFYKIRSKSITTCVNFLQKMDLIKYTNIMCDSIVEKYPDLAAAADRRRVWAYFSTINQLIKTKDSNQYKDQYNVLKEYLLSKKKIILSGKEYTKRDKIAILCFSLGFNFYKFSWGFYQKLTSKI